MKSSNPIVRFFRARILLWPTLLLFFALVAASVTAISFLWVASPFHVVTQSSSTQVIKALEKKSEVVILKLAVAEVDDMKKIKTFYRFYIPGSDRATLLKYEFDAKLGFSGDDVTITEKGDNSLLVSIPEFSFIGYDNWHTELVSQENGLLSWLTPEIDDREMAEDFIDDSKKQEYIKANLDDLREESERFYTDIAKAIDPDVTLKFVFADGTDSGGGE
ncbi:hypothetical protein [Microbacterium sp.]|uniref:hypothetical protein n=1 Tax=Microbacterium sp. TaxID=51671 RepID=UPI003A8F4FA6